MIPLGYLYIWTLGLKLYGLACLRFSVEMIYLIGAVITCKIYMDKKAFKFEESLKEVFAWKECKQYVKEFWPVLYGWYSSFIAIEFLLILIGNTHDVNFLAAWVITFQIIIIAFTSCAGIAQVTRTDMVLPMQQNQPGEAKKFAYLGIMMKGIVVFCWGILVVIFHRPLCGLFSTVPEVLDY